MADKGRIVYIRETSFQNFLGDLTTFAVLAGAFWFNYKFIGGNDAFDALLFICFFTMSVARATGIAKKIKVKLDEESENGK